MPDNCVTGLLSQAILKSLMKNIIAYPESGLYIIPALSLNDTCSRGFNSVMSVEGIIGGKFNETDIAGGTKPPLMRISLWQQTGNQTYHLTAATPITTLTAIDGHPNTYSFTLIMSDYIDINMFDLAMGIVLGIRLNTQIFELYYDLNRRDITNHRISDLMFQYLVDIDVSEDTTIRGAPLLSIDKGILYITSCINTVSNVVLLSLCHTDDSCITRLPRVMDVYLGALLIQIIIYTPTTDPIATEQPINSTSGFIYLFRNNPFTTTGSITSWVFAAQMKITSLRPVSSTNSSQLPQLQIWRSMDGAYTLNFTTMINTVPSILLGALNMYTHKLDPPASYEEGDIIGIYQPSNENAALQIAFVDSEDTALQAIVRPTTLASTGNIRVGKLSTVTVTILPLMTLSTILKVAIEPSQSHFSTRSVQQPSIMSSLDQSTSVRQPSIMNSLDQSTSVRQPSIMSSLDQSTSVRQPSIMSSLDQSTSVRQPSIMKSLDQSTSVRQPSVSIDQRSQSTTQIFSTTFQEMPLPSPTVKRSDTSKFCII